MSIDDRTFGLLRASGTLGGRDGLAYGSLRRVRRPVFLALQNGIGYQLPISEAEGPKEGAGVSRSFRLDSWSPVRTTGVSQGDLIGGGTSVGSGPNPQKGIRRIGRDYQGEISFSRPIGSPSSMGEIGSFSPEKHPEGISTQGRGSGAGG